MNREDYFADAENGKLHILLSNLTISFGPTQIATGSGYLKMTLDGQIELFADLRYLQGIEEMPMHPPFQIISPEEDSAFTAISPEGHEVMGSLSGPMSYSEQDRGQVILSVKLSRFTVKLYCFNRRTSSIFIGVLPYLEKVVYDRASTVHDFNPIFGSRVHKGDWFQFETAGHLFAGRQNPNQGATLFISTPHSRLDKNLPFYFLMALGTRVGRKLGWVAFSTLYEDAEEITIFGKPKISKKSGFLKDVVFKPVLNSLWMADFIQYLIDYPDSPVGALLELIWDAETQDSFSLKELALGVAIEGISRFIVDDFSKELKSNQAKNIVERKSVLKRSRKIFREEMEKLSLPKTKPYYQFLLNSLNNAKAYTAAQTIAASVVTICPDETIEPQHIIGWRRMRNAPAHAEINNPISQQRIDDYAGCGVLWSALFEELIFSNTKTLSQLRRHLFRPIHCQTVEIAYYNSLKPGNRSPEQNWLAAEEQLVQASIAGRKSTREIECEANLRTVLFPSGPDSPKA